MRLVPALLALAIALSCTGGGQAVARPAPAPTPSPAPSPVQLRGPAAAILADADVGLPRSGSRDHLSAGEAASLAPDQAAALQMYASWGWVDESLRSWRGGGKSLDAMVLLTLRPEGAHLAYEHFAQAAEVAPYEGRACPASLAWLDDCLTATSGAGTVVAGRLAQEVFVLDGSGLDVNALASAQAMRLTST
jgi:hypothetical protein